MSPLIIIANFLLILALIIIFATPFYLVYRHKKHDGRRQDISSEMESFFQSRQANWLVFFWAMGEALIWFVIPEFLLLLIIFMRVNRKRELLFYDIYGTIAGTILAFAIKLPVHLIDKLPYIQPRMVDQTSSWYSQHGIWGLLYQPFSGVPYKVFTFLAPHFHFFILAFLVVAVIVRIARYYIFFAIFSQIYPVFHKKVYQNYVPLFFIAVFIFSILLLRVYHNYG